MVSTIVYETGSDRTEQEVHVTPTLAPHGLHSPCLDVDFRIEPKNLKKKKKHERNRGFEDGGHGMSISTPLVLVSTFTPHELE